MATFLIKCPECGQAIDADDAWIGQSGACPKCGKPVTIVRPPAAELPPTLRAASIPPALSSAAVRPRGVPAPGAATASLVLGILSLVCLGPLTGIPAIICGHLARRKIARSGGALDGAGTALAGLIMGYVSLATLILILPLLAAIAIPNFIKAKATTEKNICINNLRLIDSGKEQWALANNKPNGAVPSANDILPYINFTSTKTLPKCPDGGTYELNPVGQRPTCSVPGHAIP